MFPSDSPMFRFIRRLHDELVAGKLEEALQIFADQGANQGALDVIGEDVCVLVDLISTERCFVSTLRVLHWSKSVLCLWIPIHHLDGHVAIAGVSKESRTIAPMIFAVSAWFFEPCQSPGADEAVLNIGIDQLILKCRRGGIRKYLCDEGK